MTIPDERKQKIEVAYNPYEPIVVRVTPIDVAERLRIESASAADNKNDRAEKITGRPETKAADVAGTK